jgi:hypothetical protein
MELPISRRRLQNYRYDEATEVNAKQRVDAILKKICKGIEAVILNTDGMKYVYHIDNTIHPAIPSRGGPTKNLQERYILPDLIDALKTNFPDSNIIMDPLKTYILIDWS